MKTGEEIAEDWGWLVPIEDAPFDLSLGCANYSEAHDTEGFLVFVKPDTPTIKRWFKSIDTHTDIDRVVSALERVLADDPDISDVQWFTTDEFHRPSGIAK